MAEYKAYDEAEHIGCDKFFAQVYQAGDQQALEDIRPCAQRKLGEGLAEGKGHAADGADAGAGVEHKHDAEAVDDDCDQKCELSAQG